MAQVRKKVGDLRRESGSYALQWRRYPIKNPTCSKRWPHLRQKLVIPAPRTRYTCPREHGMSSFKCFYASSAMRKMAGERWQ